MSGAEKNVLQFRIAPAFLHTLDPIEMVGERDPITTTGRCCDRGSSTRAAWPLRAVHRRAIIPVSEKADLVW
jgi:hypothetical protein